MPMILVAMGLSISHIYHHQDDLPRSGSNQQRRSQSRQSQQQQQQQRRRRPRQLRLNDFMATQLRDPSPTTSNLPTEF
ncbi:unnamed protein product, partial [Rotaria magnacalcarata]